MINITLPMNKDLIRTLRAGDVVSLSGTIYTARDAAHKKLCTLIAEGKPLPLELEHAVIYYCGPCPALPGNVIGSCGPTTSYRMDAYAPFLYANGADGAIGKGVIGENVKKSMQEHTAVYFLATGGAGALLQKCVKTAEVIAFPELGAEALRRLTVENMPLIVGVDALGQDIYTIGREQFRAEKK